MHGSTRPPVRLSTAIRAHVRRYRDTRTAQKTLERELASYTTADDRNDLDAILDRHSDQEAAPIRHILAARRGI